MLSAFHMTFPLAHLFNKLIGPAQRNTTYQAQEVKDFFSYLAHMQDISEEYEDLYVEYQSLQAENVKLKYLKEENFQLRQQLHVVNSEELLKNKKYVFTYVYPNPNDKSGNTMLLNAGTISGVHKGDVAISGINLVGIVKNSSSNQSILELITSPTLEIPVYNFSAPDKFEGLARGKFGTSIVLENILPNEVVKEGDILMTSARSQKIPPNLTIGKVVRVEGTNASTVKSAFVESFLDFIKLKRIYILVE